MGSRDGKMCESAKNACVNFFLGRVKSVPNLTLFSRKNELCCNFARRKVILMALNLVNW